ncbi:MAG: alkane 1-monooxygenase [Pseudomonadota bacterium]
MVSASQIDRLSRALPFWLSLAMIPLAVLGAMQGGWTLALVPLFAWTGFILLDAVTGDYTENADPTITDDHLKWYRLITLIWFPAQAAVLIWAIWYVAPSDHLTFWEKYFLFFGVGVLSGTVGINYSHELMHQKSRVERWLGDLLLATVLYSHFRTEHLLVHHRYVGTPKDAVTARYNEGFHRYFPRVLRQSLVSAFQAEKAQLARKDLPWWHSSNPFWRYWALQLIFLALAFALGGWLGLFLFVHQAFIAVWQLELVNYIEHYGLTRKHLGDGKYEHVKPRHSWNSAKQASNWLLINLQRHSDHHYRPDRRFPLLQNHDVDDAPQLPYGYPIMTLAAMIPPLWLRMMNPKVRDWRKKHYPEIEDWKPYAKGTNPMPAR